MLGVVEKLKAGDFKQDDINAIVTNAEISEKRRLESNGSRVSRMTDAFITRTPWGSVMNRLERMRKVSREDVIRVAKKYLNERFVVIRQKKGKYEPPKIEKPAITPVKINSKRESQFAAKIKGIKAPELNPEWVVEGKSYTRTNLLDGVVLVCWPCMHHRSSIVQWHS